MAGVTGITNGFNINRVMDAFQGRLGWEQPSTSLLPVTLASNNLTSTSGRFYDEFHEACTLSNIYNSQQDAAIDTAGFNALLQKLDRAVIMRCLNAVFNRNMQIEHLMNYERMSNIRNVVIPNGGNFCGYRIKVSQGNYAVKIDSVGLFFDADATFNIYLFNDLQKVPLLSKQVTVSALTQTKVQLDWIMNYVSDLNKGGLFYIGYFQNDLGNAHAVDEQLNLWANSKIFGAYPFQAVQQNGLDFNRINPSVVFRSYGISAEISSYYDYTENIIQNAFLFDEARGLLMAVRVLEMIRFCARTNAENRTVDGKTKDILMMDTNLAFPTEQQPFVAGLKAQISREYKRLNDNFFPKDKAMSVPIGGSSNGPYSYDSFDINHLPPRENMM